MPKVTVRKMVFTQTAAICQLLRLPSSTARWMYMSFFSETGYPASTSTSALEMVSQYAGKYGYRFVSKASPRRGLPTKVIKIVSIGMSKDTKLPLHSAILIQPPSEVPLHNTSHRCSAETPVEWLGNSLSGLNMHIPFSLWSFAFWVVRSFMRRVISSSFVFVSFRWSS